MAAAATASLAIAEVTSVNESVTNGTALETSMNDFCERHARTAAQHYARACHAYMSNTLPEHAQSFNEVDLLARYIDYFSVNFEKEFNRRKSHNFQPIQTTQQANQSGASASANNVSTFAEGEDGSPVPRHKLFFRRLSFKGLRKGKGLFHKQTSEDGISRSVKTKLSKIVVECRKEGLVNYLIPESMDQLAGTWEKCRLALIKTIGGYMLEFYSPPKSTKPRSGVFCFLISEARETTALEMPDHENTFVLKADNNMEYVIEARDTDDMRSWLATIRYCMRTTPYDGFNSVDAPDIPPRLMVYGRPPNERLQSNSNFELRSSNQDLEQGETDVVDLAVTLQEYPWFHGTLARNEAAQLVLHSGPEGHGNFLVRQSETRKGEFVLTFNFQGRPKHLRMSLNDHSHCRVQHLTFTSIFEMLEHFRKNPIPLESGGTSDVCLTDYVVRRPASDQRQQHLTYGGSVNVKTVDLDLTSLASLSCEPNRAVENHYSFV